MPSFKDEPPASTIAFPDGKPLTQYASPTDIADPAEKQENEGKKGRNDKSKGGQSSESDGAATQKKPQEKDKQKKSQYFERPPLTVEHRELEHLLSVKTQGRNILGMKREFFFVLVFLILVLVGYIFGDTRFTH
jgi:hypothetical protein